MCLCIKGCHLCFTLLQMQKAWIYSSSRHPPPPPRNRPPPLPRPPEEGETPMKFGKKSVLTLIVLGAFTATTNVFNPQKLIYREFFTQKRDEHDCN